MTDRELLELAANAAGIDVDYQDQYGTVYIDLGHGSTQHWNPITDDGDALRLAVRLDIDFVKSNDLKYPKSKTKWCTVTASNQEGFEAVEYEHPDPYAATRRAIVRAAAEIGKLEWRK